MEALLDSIRIAITDGASDDERRRGADACRALAQALDGNLVSSPPFGPSAGAAMPTAIAEMTRSNANGGLPHPFAGMTADQVLDLAIAKLRDAVGDTPSAPLGQPFRVPLVPVPRTP